MMYSIDHRVRYPRLSGDQYLSQFLTIFNRLAGSSDEMGTNVRGLGDLIHQHTLKVAEKDKQTAELEVQLKQAISRLEINKKDKESLEHHVEELRKHSRQAGVSAFGTSLPGSFLSSVSSLVEIQPHVASLTTTQELAAALAKGLDRTCSKCGKKFSESALSLTGLTDQLCAECRKSSSSGLLGIKTW